MDLQEKWLGEDVREGEGQLMKHDLFDVVDFTIYLSSCSGIECATEFECRASTSQAIVITSLIQVRTD